MQVNSLNEAAGTRGLQARAGDRRMTESTLRPAHVI
jgi:hypothetical protein